MTERSGIVLGDREREIIFSVSNYFDTEKNQASELLRKLNHVNTRATSNDQISINSKLFFQVIEFFRTALQATKRVARATGVSKNTITRIRREGKEAQAAGTKICAPKKKPPGKRFKKSDVGALKEIIENILKEDKEVPTLNKIYIKAKKDINFQGGRMTLRKIIKNEFGYQFKKLGSDMKFTSKPGIIIENKE